MAESMKQKHFVLVHGTNHGAWCWYKVKSWLEAAGHRVTALDLAASGINMKIQDVHTFYEYTEPLLEVLASVPPKERVILVGHSQGGLSLALAMDKFPDKISVAVFLTAFLPDTTHPPSYVVEQILERNYAGRDWLDTRFSSYDSSKPSIMSVLFGPKFLASNLYQLSPTEDLELAKMLVRPGSFFVDDLSKASKFSKEGYGSVDQVYIVCDEDKTISKDFQLWMIQNNPVKQVKEIKGADHMAMFSKPQELCDCLIELAH